MYKMNRSIVIVNQYIGSPHHGMEYRHYFLAKNLMALGYQVTLVSGAYSHLFSQLPKTQGKFTHEKIDAIEYIWVKVPKYRSSKSIGRILCPTLTGKISVEIFPNTKPIASSSL